MIPITQSFITNKANRPFVKLPQLKGIVIHWTSNTGKGANASAHCNYFQNHDVQASAHYMADDKSIMQIIPDDEVAYHVGSRYYKPVGQSLMEGGKSPNYFLIGIEMCVNPDSVWEDTYRNTVELTQHLLQKYNLDTQQVWRHWDITGKDCPKMMCESEDDAWGRFLNCVKTSIFPNEKQPIASGIVNSEILNIRQGNGTYFPLAGTLAKNDRVNIFEQLGSWYRIGKGQWVSRSLVSAQGVQQSGKAGIVNTARLNVRFGPSTYHPVTGSLIKGDKITIYNQEGDWYHIGDNRWANKNFIISEQESLRKGRVIANSLNIRSGAGTNQPVVGWLKKNDKVSILDERSNWLRIGPNQWVHGAYISEIVIKRGRVNTARLNIRTGPGTSFGVAGCLQQNEWVNIEQEEGAWFGIGVDRWVHRDFILLEDFREK